jgi:hypothetical protein
MLIVSLSVGLAFELKQISTCRNDVTRSKRRIVLRVVCRLSSLVMDRQARDRYSRHRIGGTTSVLRVSCKGTQHAENR